MSADPDARLRAFARLLVRTGVNLNEGQELLVHAQHEHAPFVRAIAQEAYAAGARFVDVAYADRWVQRAFVETAPDEMLGWTPPWMVARLERAIEVGAAIIGVSADSGAEVYRGPRRRTARARTLPRLRPRVDGRRHGPQARVVARRLPDRGLGARGARASRTVDRLWDAFAHALRLDEPDPAAAWAARLDELQARARELTARAFTALRYRGPGTDLEVGLIEGARWLAGRERTVHGQVHAPNLPTEEVFTSPHRQRADGTIRSTMPLALRGTIVEGLELRVAGGEIVEARATRGEDALRAELAIDDGARRFGEVALVDASSRVGETGVIFNNTLFDENAAAHIAWGNATAVGPGPRPRARSTSPRASTSPPPTRTSWSAHRRSRSMGSRPGVRRWRCCATGIWQL